MGDYRPRLTRYQVKLLIRAVTNEAALVAKWNPPRDAASWEDRKTWLNEVGELKQLLKNFERVVGDNYE